MRVTTRVLRFFFFFFKDNLHGDRGEKRKNRLDIVIIISEIWRVATCWTLLLPINFVVKSDKFGSKTSR